MVNLLKFLNEVKTILLENKYDLERKFQVKSIALFGSHTRGQQRTESDIDLLIEFSSPVSLLHIVIVENYLTDLLGTPVDVILKKNLRKELRSAILKEAIHIWND